MLLLDKKYNYKLATSHTHCLKEQNFQSARAAISYMHTRYCFCSTRRLWELASWSYSHLEGKGD